MAVEPRLSGGQNNTSPNGSIGGQLSDTKITDDILENLFDAIIASIIKLFPKLVGALNITLRPSINSM